MLLYIEIHRLMPIKSVYSPYWANYPFGKQLSANRFIKAEFQCPLMIGIYEYQIAVVFSWVIVSSPAGLQLCVIVLLRKTIKIYRKNIKFFSALWGKKTQSSAAATLEQRNPPTNLNNNSPYGCSQYWHRVKITPLCLRVSTFFSYLHLKGNSSSYPSTYLGTFEN